MNDKILVVDDELRITKFIARILEGAGYRVFQATDGVMALKEFFASQPQLVLVDIMMPLMDGYTLCRRIREVSNVPIIIVSGVRTDDMDKVKGLDIGADDYITKPFSTAEFVARVSAALRRYRMPPTDTVSQYSDSVLFIDFQKRDIRVNGQPVSLTPAEFVLLTALVTNADKVLTWKRLFELLNLEGEDAYDVVKWHMFSLRRKIEEKHSQPKLIVNVRGVGYRYTPPDLT